MARLSTLVLRHTALAFLSLLVAFPCPAPAQQVQYYYDALNRLIGVMDPQGHMAEYV